MIPRINGNTYSHTSITLTISGIPYVLTGVKELTYSWKMDPGKVFGTSVKKLARTSGQAECSGSMSLYLEEADFIRKQLAFESPTGYGMRGVDISVYMEEPELPTREDILKGVRFTGGETSSSAGNEAPVVKFDLDLMDLIENGTPYNTEFTSF